MDTFTTWTLTATGVLALAGAGLALTATRRGVGQYRALTAFHAWLAAMPSAVLIGTLLANLDAPTWLQVTGQAGIGAEIAVKAIAVPLAVSGAAAAVSAALAGRGAEPARRQDPPSPSAASVELAEGQRAVWTGGTTNTVLAALCLFGPASVTLLVDTVSGTEPSEAAYLGATGVGLLVALLISRLRAVVDASGVTIRMGALGWPRKRVPLADIASAEARDIKALSMGGIGIRMHPLTGDTAYKVRGGPALLLTLRTGRRVFVSVDAPERAAGLLNDLIRRVSPERT